MRLSLDAKLKLFKFPKRSGNCIGLPEYLMGYQVKVFKPVISNLSKVGAGFLVNLFWHITTAGRFKILYLEKDNTIVHYSYITSKTFRFPFMKIDDIQIGPCFTQTNFRGKGIFTEVLKLINEIYLDRDKWIYTTVSNFASQKAFQRSGFVFYSLANMSQLTKIVKPVNSLFDEQGEIRE